MFIISKDSLAFNLFFNKEKVVKKTTFSKHIYGKFFCKYMHQTEQPNQQLIKYNKKLYAKNVGGTNNWISIKLNLILKK